VLIYLKFSGRITSLKTAWRPWPYSDGPHTNLRLGCLT